MRTKRTSRRYLTRSEVARLFEVAPATVTRWSHEGKLRCVMTLGGQRRYLRDQVMRLVSGAQSAFRITHISSDTAMTGKGRHRP